MLVSCNTNSSNDNRIPTNQNFPGEEVGLVFLWTIDDSGAEQGTAAFPLYDDNGTFYVDFHGTPYILREISPVDIGGNVLCYAMPTEFGTYYLEDVSNPSFRSYSL